MCNPSQTPPSAHRESFVGGEKSLCVVSPFSNLQKEFQGVLQNLLELTHPLGTDGTVNNLVVEAASEGDLVVPLDGGLAILVGGRDSDLAGGADSQDSGLGRVDDGSEVRDGVVHAHVGDGNGAALVLLGLELAVTSLLGELLDLVGDGLQTTALNTGDNGGDEAGGGGNGDGHVDGRELADNITAPARVGSRDSLRGDAHGLDEEVVDGQLVLAVSRAVQGLSQLQELGHGD